MEAKDKVVEAPNLILFESEGELKPLLESIDIKVREEAVYRPNGDRAKCDCCGDDITLTNLESVMPGSEYFYCSKPECLLKYYERTL